MHEIASNAGVARQASAYMTPGTPLPAALTDSAGNSGYRIDQPTLVIQKSHVDPGLIAEIQAQWRMRQLWVSVTVKLTLQAKSFCRSLASDGSKTEAAAIWEAATEGGSHPMASLAMAAMLPLLESRDEIDKRRAVIERRLKKLVKQLPAASFVQDTYGASLIGLAAIVGEAGNLCAYANPGKLWKRMGLAPYAGRACSIWRKEGGLSAQDWIDAGYKPRRRSMMFIVGGGLIGGMSRGKRPLVGQDLSEVDWSPLEKLFVERLRYEAARDPENMARPATPEGRESYSQWAIARARRYVEKRFLLMLWRAWNGHACVDPAPSDDELDHQAQEALKQRKAA